VKWSDLKCSDVRWNGEVGNLSGVKPNESVVKCIPVKFKMRGSEVSTSVVMWSEVKCSEDLSNRPSNIIRYMDRMKFTT
jgi:hypothetical protein